MRRSDRVERVGEGKRVGLEERIEKPSGEVYELVDQVARVADAVLTGTPVACTGEDGRWSVAMCLKAQESLAAGQPVPFGEG